MKIVPVRLITEHERCFAEVFQEILGLTLKAFPGAKGRDTNLLAYKELKKQLKRFHNYPFVKVITQRTSEWDRELIDVFQSKRGIPNKQKNLTQKTDQLVQLFMNNNFNAAFSLAKEVQGIIHGVEKFSLNPNELLKTKKNPLYIENPLFFGRNGLLPQFEKHDQEEVLSKNFDEFKYTFLPLPDEKVNDFEFIVYWIQSLKSKDQPVELNPHEFKYYNEFVYGSELFEELKKKVDSYLHSNLKSLIPEILSLIKKIPDLNQTNEELKHEIHTLYRGVPLEADSTFDQVQTHEQEQKIVACSKSRNVAKRFAFQIGHLESEDSRRSEEAVIIKYNITPEAILLDTSVLGGVYSEEEVLIDTSKVNFDDVEYEYI